MIIQFWQDKGAKKINPDLFSIQADELAKSINIERQNSRDKFNKSTQLRKFFDEVIRFQGMLQSNPEQFEELLPYIKMLNAKAAYAAGRDLIGTEFKNFLSDSLKQVNSREDFEIFCTFFEAFIGFYKFYAEKEKGGAVPGYQQHNNGGQQQGGYKKSEPQIFRK